MLAFTGSGLAGNRIIIERDKYFDLRWMTPTVEVEPLRTRYISVGPRNFSSSRAQERNNQLPIAQWRAARDNPLRIHPVLIEAIRKKDAARGGKFRSAVASYSMKTEEKALESMGTR